MLNIEVIKFEAQDVITASGEVPATQLQPAHKHEFKREFDYQNLKWVEVCECGAKK